MTRLFRLLAALLFWLGAALPAHAAVTITFWSHEFGNSFPHAFFTLRGVPDAGGQPVNQDYGFTAKAVTPALLFGSVPGRVEPARPAYIASSDAQFSVVMTDAQYAQVLALIAAWDEHSGDGHYNLNNRNCVHFVKEAARIVGLSGLDQPQLMKKPRSYLLAVEAANGGRVRPINQPGRVYLASLPPIDARPAPTNGVPTAPPPVQAAPAAPLAPVPAR